MNRQQLILLVGILIGCIILGTFIYATQLCKSKTTLLTMNQESAQTNKLVEDQVQVESEGVSSDILFYNDCSKEQDNVSMTECKIKVLDQVAAEREWKQRKIEAIKYPQIDEPNFDRILEDAQLTIKAWRESFEKNRDLWCNASLSFASNGSGMPSALADCQAEIELKAIKVLNNIYYENIMKDIVDSDGISDFEPAQSDIESLTQSNKTKRGCVWAKEDSNCD